MSDRPILFSAPMIRAILAGRKTQTRRLLPEWWHWGGRARLLESGIVALLPEKNEQPIAETRVRFSVGDRLWVRETHAWADHMADGVEREAPVCVAYRADQTAISHEHENVHALDTTAWNWDRFKWRPSIFMPRWASRLTLEVTGVRVERLQDITAPDVVAEGAVERDHHNTYVSAFDGKAYLDLQSLWAAGWDAINAKRATWASNPWVAVVTFKRLP